ncbi:Peroxidasin [Chionoecetes opilio]|uniref:Peroxidasin n=1 Tax=Chionoecetes opilio TaxID=41210 RepID=A0A8J4XMD5_CHIOP|nr:Peroxidasin [Chionoecetes opilio]
MDFVRSLPAVRPGCNFGPREQMNQITAFIDASNVYGSSVKESAELRAFSGGLLKVNNERQHLLPPKPSECKDSAGQKYCFKAGDSRVNEQPQLAVMHTLWMRQHNRLARELASLNPGWKDEIIFQEARRIVAAQMQHITYNEYLPIIFGLNEGELKYVRYHSECRKPIVNKNKIKRLRKRSRTDSPVCAPRGPGRPSSAVGSVRPKRSKTIPKEQVCLFSNCDFCPKNDSEPLHRVLTDSMGKTLLQIKQKTPDDHVRVSVADLEEPGDISALEKHYHRTCLRSAQRISTRTDHSNVPLILSVCDAQLVLPIQNTLSDEDVTLSMAEVNDAYLSILKRYRVDVNESENYRKYLKRLISERLPEVKFVTSLRRNEPDRLVLSTAVTMAMDYRSSMMNDDEIVGHLKNVANLLREEMLQQRSWSFTGSFSNFENPSLLQFFMSHLLFGSHVVKVSGIRDQEVDKTVDVSCQFLVQNTRTDRQVKHQTKKDSAFRQNRSRPLCQSVFPLLFILECVTRILLKTSQLVYIGSDYLHIIDLEKRVEQSVLQR